jgi:hypothetical protein
MKRFYLLSCLLFALSAAHGQSWSEFNFKSGDLLFQDLDCGDLCDAIEAVTPGVDGKHFSHVGLAYVAGDSTYVIEAIGQNVHLIPISQFMARQTTAAGKPQVIVGRLKTAYAHLNPRAVGFALQQRGKPYDDEFKYDNGKYYCSELIYDAYKEANKGEPFFNLYPMTYKNPKTGNTVKAWKSYFKKLHTSIPEGKPGCNPGSIAMNGNVEIVQSFY